MNLYLLRHGLATELTPDQLAQDAERRLTPKGIRKLRKIAAGMNALELRFDLILSSPYTRARQTAELVARQLQPRKRVVRCDDLAPGGDPRELIAFLRGCEPVPAEVLLVGHEPYLSNFISLLTTGSAGCRLTLKKGGLAKMRAESLKPGQCATLEWLFGPKQLALLG
jgi:phosphohistidine phosphatase